MDKNGLYRKPHSPPVCPDLWTRLMTPMHMVLDIFPQVRVLQDKI